MYVRLAFAVAAHLEPEILIVDEVLAVGDAAVPAQVPRPHGGAAPRGRTVLFVSHNLEMIESLCTRGIVLHQGGLVFDGKVHDALDRYRALGGSNNEVVMSANPALRWGGIRNRLDLRGLRADQDIPFELVFHSGPRQLDKIHIDCELVDANGRRATHSKSRFVSPGFTIEPNQTVMFRYTIKSPKLAPGRYYMIMYAYEPHGPLSWVERIDACDISARAYFGTADFVDDIKAATVPEFTVELEDTRSAAVGAGRSE